MSFFGPLYPYSYTPADSGYAYDFLGQKGINDMSLPKSTEATPAKSGLAYEDPFSLASRTNKFMAGEAMGQYTANMPGYADLVAQRSGIIGSQLKGEVGDDVLNQIINAGAARGILTGSYGTAGTQGGGASQASWLSALGTTSMAQQDKGVKNLSQAIADTPVAEVFNPASLFVPERFAQQELDVYNSMLGKRVGGVTVVQPQWTPTFSTFNV